MADVELVIKIDEGIAKGIIDGENDTPRHIVRGFQSTIADAIKNGTPLPQGHGRLIDADDIDNHIIGHVDTRSCPTIIKAESEERDDKRRSN